VSSKSDDTRARILDATRRLLEEHGPSRTALKDVAAAAGVSRQAVYLHFENRIGLLVALVDHVDQVEGLADATAPILAAPSGRAALERTIRVLAEYAPRIHRIASVIEAASLSDEAMAAAFADRMDQRRRSFRRVFERIADEGALQEGFSVDTATDAFWALTTPRSFDDLVIKRGWSVEQYAALLRRVAFSTLVREA